MLQEDDQRTARKEIWR